MQELYPVSETVPQNVEAKSDADSCFDGRNNAGKTVVLLHYPRFLLYLRKDGREEVVVIWIIFAGQADQRFGRNLGKRNGAASSKRMQRSDGHAHAFLK